MISSYQNSVINDSASESMAQMVGWLSAIVLINQERMGRFPEEARAFFVEILGPTGGELAFRFYWRFLRAHKEGLDV